MHAIGSDPAFIFIDPTGWTGAAIRYIEPLLDGRFRDVMIRVPSEIYRFKDRGKSGDRTAGCSVRWHPRDPGALGCSGCTAKERQTTNSNKQDSRRFHHALFPL